MYKPTYTQIASTNFKKMHFLFDTMITDFYSGAMIKGILLTQ